MPEYNKEKLDLIADEIQDWLDHQKSLYKELHDDYRIALPTTWPTIGDMKKWIKILHGEKN